MDKIKINPSEIAIEIISVVLAVSLALIGNEFRENYNYEKLADIALINLNDEVKNNKVLLQKSIEKHEKSTQYLSNFLNEREVDSSDQSYHFDRLDETAWETMKISQVTQSLDFKLTSKISKLYGEQKIYNDLIIKMMDNMIFEGNFGDKESTKKTLKRHLVNFYILLEMERDLMKSINKFLSDNETSK